MKNEISMTQFTATVADSLGINAPDGAEEKIPLMASYLQKRDISKVDKVLIYNPDAIGMWLFQKYTTWFAPVLNHTQLGNAVRYTGLFWNDVYRSHAIGSWNPEI